MVLRLNLLHGRSQIFSVKRNMYCTSTDCGFRICCWCRCRCRCTVGVDIRVMHELARVDCNTSTYEFQRVPVIVVIKLTFFLICKVNMKKTCIVIARQHLSHCFVCVCSYDFVVFFFLFFSSFLVLFCRTTAFISIQFNSTVPLQMCIQTVKVSIQCTSWTLFTTRTTEMCCRLYYFPSLFFNHFFFSTCFFSFRFLISMRCCSG